MDCAQIAYFESAEPRKPRMRVAKTKEVSHSSWDRSEHAHKHTSPEPLGRANSGTYIHKAEWCEKYRADCKEGVFKIIQNDILRYSCLVLFAIVKLSRIRRSASLKSHCMARLLHYENWGYCTLAKPCWTIKCLTSILSPHHCTWWGIRI